MKIKKLTSIALSAMMAAAVVPFNEVTVPYSNITSYAVEADAVGIIAEGTFGENIAWTLYDGGQLSISGYGAIMDCDGANPWGEYSDDITSVVLHNEITEIGDYAFYGCENLIYVSLEYKGGLDRIGFNAFDGCTNLMDLEVGGNIGNIGDFAFNGCEMLEKITITNPECSIVDSEFVFPENTVIEGFAGSTAEIYSNNYNREFVSLDVTPDSGEQAVVAEGTCGENLTWTLDNEGFLLINGNGAMDSYEGYSNWEDHINDITSVLIDKDVDNIGDYAFYNCKNIYSADLTPVIGAHAFEGCTSLSSISCYADRLPSEIKDYAFYGCDNLGAFIIENPDCIIADSPYVFPEDMVIYGVAGSTAEAYAEKYNREFVEISAPGFGEQEVVAEGTCGENLTWTLYDDGYIYIDGDGAMDNWASADDVPWAEYRDQIKRIRAPKEVKNVGDYAFYDCVNLEYAFCATIIGEHAYENCKNITNYYLYEEPIEIKDYAFYGCDKLNSVTIHNSSCVIADSEFVFPENSTIRAYAGSTAQVYAEKYNREFKEISAPDSGEQEVVAEGTCGENLTWTLDNEGFLLINGNGAMDSYEGYSNWEDHINDITSVLIDKDVDNIGDYAFYNCKNIYSADLTPVIGAHAFEGCTSLSSIGCYADRLPSEIKDYAFYGCDSLEFMSIENPDCIIADSPYVFPEDMVIYGVAGSTAEAYAEKYNREFVEISAPDLGWQAVVAKGTCGENLTWKIYEDERCLIVSGYGAMDSYENPDETPWADYYNYIGAVRLESGVENIGENTFASLNSGYLDIIIIENPDCFIPDSETTIPARMTIGGAAGSTAEAYAEKYNREFLAIVENDEISLIAEGMCGESAKWALYDGGFLEIYGEGKMVNYDDFSDTPWAEYADSIQELSIGENIVSISENAFAGCPNIRYTSIYNSKCKIPNSIYALPTTSIIGYCGSTAEAYAKKYHMGFMAIPTVIASGQCGENIDWAVYDVGILSIDGTGTMVDFDDFSSTPWFEYADLITEVNVGDIDSVGENAFSGLTKLQDISFNNLKCVIPDSEDAIPDKATINGNFGSLAIEYAKKYDKDYYIYTYEIARGELVNGQNWTLDSDGYLLIDGSGDMPNYEGDNPWSELADSIIAAELNSDITSIGDYAFYNCTNLRHIFTKANVIGEHAFDGCTSLLPVDLDEADKIGDYAFHNTDVSRVVIFNPECEIADSPYVFPEDTVIYGYENSTAEEYARKYERMFLAFQTFLLGDVNDDGKIDSTDASAVLAEYAAAQTGGELTLSKDAADVNDDGLVNSSDASAILEYYAKASIGEEPSWNFE